MPVELTLRAMKRRGWVIVVGALVAAIAGLALGHWQARSHSSEAVLVVSAAGGTPTRDVDQGTGLAETYARVISLDDSVREGLRDNAGNGSQIFASSRSGVITVRVEASSSTRAVSGARAVHDMLLTPGGPAPGGVDRSLLYAISNPRATGPNRDGRQTAHMTLGVRVVAGIPSGSADQSTKLAVTYAGVIPDDDQIQRTLARQLRTPIDTVRSAISAANVPNTAIVRVTYRSSKGTDALLGVQRLARAVAGPRPASDAIVPGSVKAVHVPTSPDSDGGILVGILAAAILGAILGLVVLVSWERHDLMQSQVEAGAQEPMAAHR